jgi:hypothetical protein
MRSVTRICLAAILLILSSGCVQKKSVSIQGLEEQARDIIRISGYEHIYRDIVYIGKRESVLGIPTMDKRLLFSIDIRVVAGIDAADGFAVSPFSSEGITVALPAPKILLVDADEATIRQFFVREKGGKIQRLEYYDEIERSKARIAEDAVKRGILLKAEGNIRKLITDVFTAAGIKEIRFETGPEKKT